MSRIDPGMIQGRSEGIRSDDRSQRWKVLRLPRRSEDRMVIRLDPRYESIIWLLSLDLVSLRAIPECARGGEHYRGRYRKPITCKSRLVGEREEGVDDVGRREASLVTSAMSGLAISDRCTVTWYRGSQVRSGRDDGWE